MASPQTENGFTKIANELLDKVVNTSLLGAEFQILLTLVRKTYGFNKKADIISLSQFEKITGLSRPTVVKALRNLVVRKMVVKTALPHTQMSFSINKDYDSWVVKTAKLVKHNDKGSKARLTDIGKAVLTHKRKKEITKESGKQSLPNDQFKGLIDSFKEVNPMYLDFYRNTTERKALEDMVASLSYEKLLNTIKALPEIINLPYAPRITKPTELKRDLGKLIAFYNQEKGKLKTNSKIAFI